MKAGTPLFNSARGPCIVLKLDMSLPACHRGQQGYEERMSQPGVGPSQPNPSGPNSPPMRQWSGTGWQYQPSQQYPPQPGVNPREWQRMQQGGLSSQKPPDRDHQQEGEVKVNQGNDRRNG